MSHCPSEPTKFLTALPAFRFFAAVLVVLSHFHYTFWSINSFGIFGDFGQVVSFFFMLSGFTLAYAYPNLQLKESGRFLLGRMIRIWPIHLLVLGLTFLLLPKIVEKNMAFPDAWQIVTTNILLVQSWVPVQSYFFSYNTPTWYLSTQFALYLLFPILIHHFRKNWPLKLLITMAFVLTCIWGASGLELFTMSKISGQGLLYVSPVCRLFEFVLGMAGAVLFSGKISRFQPNTLAATALEIATLLLTVAAMAAGTPVSKWLLAHLPVYGEALGFYLEVAGLTLLPFFLLIQIFALGRGWVSKLLALPVFAWLGGISFGIYMLHIVLLHYYLYPVALKPHIPQPTTERILIYWALLLVSAYLSQRFIETPIKKGLGSLLKQRREKNPSLSVQEPETLNPEPTAG